MLLQRCRNAEHRLKRDVPVEGARAVLARGAFRVEGEPPVAEHEDAVGEPLDLTETVAHEEDRESLGPERPQNVEEPVGLRRRQRRGRLVEDQESRRRTQGAREDEQLCVRGAEPSGIRAQHVIRPVEAQPGQRGTGRAFRRGPTDESGSRRGQIREQKVVGDREAWHDAVRDALVHRLDPGATCERGRGQTPALTGDADRAGVVRVGARDGADERRLPGAVGAEKRRDRARLERERDVFEYPVGAEAHADAAQADNLAVARLSGVLRCRHCETAGSQSVVSTSLS